MAISVLVVDDSAALRALLSAALETDPGIHVVGQAADGQAAVAMVEQLQPKVVIMDVMMPVMDGIEASRRILARRHVPILLMSTLARMEEQRAALECLHLGVLEVASKPVLAGAGRADGVAQVVRLVRAAAQAGASPSSPPRRTPSAPQQIKRMPKIIVIGASTGGPQALERILTRLPSSFPPIIIAQHLAPTLALGFIDWLSTALGRSIQVVDRTSTPLRASCIFVAGDSQHLSVRRGVVGAIPSVPGELAASADVLFHSTVCYGADALGVVLSGMGSDGARGLKAMRMAGSWTIGQDQDSSVVFGMPRAALDAGACCEMISLDAIGNLLSGVTFRQDLQAT